eukprot:866592-Prorocentrum_minimum.AAC.3
MGPKVSTLQHWARALVQFHITLIVFNTHIGEEKVYQKENSCPDGQNYRKPRPGFAFKGFTSVKLDRATAEDRTQPWVPKLLKIATRYPCVLTQKTRRVVQHITQLSAEDPPCDMADATDRLGGTVGVGSDNYLIWLPPLQFQRAQSAPIYSRDTKRIVENDQPIFLGKEPPQRARRRASFLNPLTCPLKQVPLALSRPPIPRYPDRGSPPTVRVPGGRRP